MVEPPPPHATVAAINRIVGKIAIGFTENTEIPVIGIEI